MMNISKISDMLTTGWAGRELIYYKETDSTNVQGKNLVKDGIKHGAVVIAETQTAGRGRRGRTWISPLEDAVYMTLILRPNIALENASMLTLVAALAVVNAIEELQITNACKIKWPNDIVMGKKKVCGILTELTTANNQMESVLIGIGINVNAKEFSEAISQVATSLYCETGQLVNRELLIATVMNQFERYYELFLKTEDLSALAEGYNDKLIHRYQDVFIEEAESKRQVRAIGIDERGALIVELQNGDMESIIAGEVSVRGIYGYV